MRDIRSYPDAHLRVFDRPAIPDSGISDVYLIGICGTGMGSLAGLMRQAGYAVRGSDRAAWPPMSEQLAEMDIPVYEGYTVDNLDPIPDFVVVGNACVPTHPEAAFVRERGLPQASLPETLYHFFIRGRHSVVVAGTHGKTSTTGLLVHVLKNAGMDPGYLVGGVAADGSPGYAVGSAGLFVTEGDEYDSAYFDKRPKFLHYAPDTAIVTSIEFDHADIYDDINDYHAAFEEFAKLVSGKLFLYGDDARVRSLARMTDADVLLYGLGEGNDVTATPVLNGPGGQRFELFVGGRSAGEFDLPAWGRHNLLNALAVCGVSTVLGVGPTALQTGLQTFPGMKRRQEIRGEAGGVTVVDDFAHHPTAVRETIRGTVARWPDRRLLVVFEPRSNSSRRKVFEDAYAESLTGAHRVFLCTPPLRHNDDPEDFLSPEAIATRLNRAGWPVTTYRDPDAALPDILEVAEQGDVILIMSNGAVGNLHERLLASLAG
jgi:UDP-N-acetylmuramate: L-alanyl-gamma-D-glutamyl-meso-diaminopimelate ligase